MVEFSGAQLPEQTPADDAGRAGEVSGPQPSGEELATAESSQIGSVATTTQDDKHGDVRACVDEHDCSVMPTALDSTGDLSHPVGDLGTGCTGIGFDDYGLLEAGSEVPLAQDTSRLMPSTNDTGASLSTDASLGVQSAILSVGIDKPKFFWEVDPFFEDHLWQRTDWFFGDARRSSPRAHHQRRDTPGHLVFSSQTQKSQNRCWNSFEDFEVCHGEG